MRRGIRTVINWIFRWGEHAKFATDIAEYFGLWKMVISVEAGLLAAIANWQETKIISPFWLVALGFAIALVIINAVWGLINKWRFPKHQILAAATAGPDSTVHELIVDQPVITAVGSSLIASEAFIDRGKLDGWEKLYEEYDTANGKELRLRFLPDGDDQTSDALLLICYGYKIIRKIDAISRRFANNQIEYLLQNAPGTRQPYIAGIMASINNLAQERDFGQKCKDEGTVERLALSEGGKYRLTAWGENKAKELACDMIARA